VVHDIEICGPYVKNNVHVHVKLQSFNNGNKTKWSLTWAGLHSYHLPAIFCRN